MTMTADQKLISKFYELFGNKAKGHLVDIQDGPSVCNFIFEPEKDASVSSLIKAIRNSKEVILIPDNNRMNIQIPKSTRERILFKDLIKSTEYKKTKNILPMILGVGSTGKPIVEDLTKMPHFLIVGNVGCGKDMFINGILKSITTKTTSRDCKLMILDTVCVDFRQWDKDSHSIISTSPTIGWDKTFQELDNILTLIDNRYQMLCDNKVGNIIEYKKKTNKSDMPFIVVVIPELGDFMSRAPDKTEYFIKTLCSKGRAVGIHLIAATCRPDSQTLTKNIKVSFPTRITFWARNGQNSKFMFGELGAERLKIVGDMLYGDAGCIPIRIHAAFVTEEDIVKKYK